MCRLKTLFVNINEKFHEIFHRLKASIKLTSLGNHRHYMDFHFTMVYYGLIKRQNAMNANDEGQPSSEATKSVNIANWQHAGHQ